MFKEKRFILVNRIVSLFIVLINIFILILPLWNNIIASDTGFVLYMIAFFCISITLIIFICSLFLSYKIYKFNGNIITIYAGYYNHYIKVNGETFDEHKTLISFTPIILSCTLEDGNLLQATISTSNRISLKINNKLFKNQFSIV